jgi:dephospho-CoA kinase
MTTLCLTGLPAAGKTAVAEIVSNALQLPIVDVARLLEEAIPPSANRLSRADIGPAFVALFGREAVTDVVEARVVTEPNDVILDAVRLPETIERLRATCGVVTIFVGASPAVRGARLRERVTEEYRSPRAIRRALRSYSAYDGEEAELRRLSDVVIDNNGTRADLEREVLEYLVQMAPRGKLVA